MEHKQQLSPSACPPSLVCRLPPEAARLLGGSDGEKPLLKADHCDTRQHHTRTEEATQATSEHVCAICPLPFSIGVRRLLWLSTGSRPACLARARAERWPRPRMAPPRTTRDRWRRLMSTMEASRPRVSSSSNTCVFAVLYLLSEFVCPSLCLSPSRHERAPSSVRQ
jgi:hypothetical protein